MKGLLSHLSIHSRRGGRRSTSSFKKCFRQLLKRFSERTGKRLKDKVVLFNPGSRQQTAQRLQERYGEISFDKTEKGNVKVDDEVLEKLGEKYPEAKLLAEYQTLNRAWPNC